MNVWKRIFGKSKPSSVDPKITDNVATKPTPPNVSHESTKVTGEADKPLTSYFLPGPDLLNWTQRARAYVEQEQESRYRSLADLLDLGSDPVKAFELLCDPVMPMEHVAPAKLINEMGLRSYMSPEDARAYEAELGKNITRFFEIQPPTRYENPMWYRSMAMTLNLLLTSLKTQGELPSPSPLVATLPTGDLNARILPVPGDGVPVIFFEQGLFHFVNGISRVIASAMPRLSRREIIDDNALRQLPRAFSISENATNYFYSAVYAYLVKGTPKENTASLEDPSANALVAQILIQEGELFVIAHELAHFTEGHLCCTPQTAKDAWKQEYEADAAGLRMVTRRAFDVYGSCALAAWACDVMLGFFHFLGYAAATLQYGSYELRWISKTYPPPLSRQQYLRNNLVQLVPPAAFFSGLCAVGALDDLTQDLFNHLWELTRGRFLDAHKQGIRPSPLWREQIESTFAPDSTLLKET